MTSPSLKCAPGFLPQQPQNFVVTSPEGGSSAILSWQNAPFGLRRRLSFDVYQRLSGASSWQLPIEAGVRAPLFSSIVTVSLQNTNLSNSMFRIVPKLTQDIPSSNFIEGTLKANATGYLQKYDQKELELLVSICVLSHFET